MESELFGHEQGAFTGAQARKKGRFELAHGGTLFLDEIGELSLATQVKLLRVLQEREFERVGGTEVHAGGCPADRSHQPDLEQAISERRFREDLYYRLNVFPIFLPPLRERKPDILLLADHFVEKYAKAHERPVQRITTPAIDMLIRYHWPGNVRELENVIERAVVVCDGDRDPRPAPAPDAADGGGHRRGSRFAQGCGWPAGAGPAAGRAQEHPRVGGGSGPDAGDHRTNPAVQAQALPDSAEPIQLTFL